MSTAFAEARAALAPLLSIADVDERATVMVVLGLPIMVVASFLATTWFGQRLQAET